MLAAETAPVAGVKGPKGGDIDAGTRCGDAAIVLPLCEMPLVALPSPWLWTCQPAIFNVASRSAVG